MRRDWVHGVGHSPVYQILLQIVVRASVRGNSMHMVLGCHTRFNLLPVHITEVCDSTRCFSVTKRTLRETSERQDGAHTEVLERVDAVSKRTALLNEL